MVSRKVRGATAVTLAALVGALGGMPAVSWADTLAKTDAAAKTEQAATTAAATTGAATTEAATTQAATTEAKSGDQVALASETAPDSQEGKAAATNGKFYDTVQQAIDAAAADGTVWVYGNTDENVTVRKKVSITGVGDVSEQAFSGTISFVAGSEGSSVSGVHFTFPVAEGKHNAVSIIGVDHVSVYDNTFDAPSALLKGKEWQRNGVWVQNAKNVSINQNKFNLGRLNDTNGSGDVAVDINSNAAVNLVGGGDGNVSDVHVTNNILTVTAPDGAATRDASVNLLIANGNSKDGQYGVKNVTVDNNTYVGSADAANTNTRFAGISNVSGITFTNNKVSDAALGVAQSVWYDSTSQNDGVTVGDGNSFTNVASPFEANTVPSEDRQTGNGAFVTKADGTFAAYGWISDAVKAINDGDDSFAGATLTINKNLYNHQEFTFNKKVTVTTTPGSVYTFNGSITLQGEGSVVKGMNFVLDFKDYVTGGQFKAGIQDSLTVSKASNVVIQDNTFTIPSVNLGNVDFQPNAIKLQYRMTGTKILNNQFNLGRAYNNSTVGINFIGNAGSAAIKDTLIQGNKATFTEDAYEGTSGSAMMVIANGNAAGQNDYGVQGLTVTGNNIDGSKVPTKDFAFSISNVRDLKLDDNTVKGVYMVVSQSMWGGTSHPSTGLVITKNKLEDNDYNVYLDYFFNTGKMKPSDISYGTGADANTVTWTKYKAQNPSVSGLAFAGWYADSSFKTPATDSSQPAYAKFVPVSDVVKYMGNSLRLDGYKNSDGSVDYSKTDLRFGYNIVAPNESHEAVEWSWKAGFNGVQKWTVKGTNRRALTDADKANGYTEGVVSNLLVEGVPSRLYASANLYSVLTVQYKTDDGTLVSVSDSTRTRTVEDLAKTIAAEGTADEVTYAKGLLAQISAAK